MERTLALKQNSSYETTELKLAALLLSEIPEATFEALLKIPLTSKTVLI